MGNTQTRLIGLGVTLLALACRLPWALAPRTVRWDEPDYLILAHNLLHGRGYQIFGVPDTVWPPGAPLLAAAAQALGAPVAGGLAVWQVVAGALACGLLFGLVRDVTGDTRLAAGAGLLAAASPALAVWPLYWGSATEAPFLAALLAGWWAGWRAWRHGSRRAACLAGLMFGVSYLIRTEGLLWWGLFVALLALGAVRKSRLRLALIGLIVTFGLMAAPYIGYLHSTTGRWLLSGKEGLSLIATPAILAQGGLGQDIFAQLDSQGTEILWLSPEQFDISLLGSLMVNPVAVLRRIPDNVRLTADALAGPLLGVTMLALAGLGVFVRPWSRQRWQQEWFWLALLIPLGVLLISKVETRYLVPLLPVIFIWASRGIEHLAMWLRDTASAFRRLPVRAIGGLMLAFVLLVNIWQQMAANQVGQDSQTPSHEAAGRWLAAHAEPGAAVMSRNSEIGLYADRPLVAFPDATWEQVLRYGRARQMRFLVTDDWELTHLRPQLGALAQASSAPSALRLEAVFADARRTTLVYRVIE